MGGRRSVDVRGDAGASADADADPEVARGVLLSGGARVYGGGVMGSMERAAGWGETRAGAREREGGSGGRAAAVVGGVGRGAARKPWLDWLWRRGGCGRGRGGSDARCSRRGVLGGVGSGRRFAAPEGELEAEHGREDER